MSIIPELKTLYEVDDSLWLEETIAFLKEKNFEALDLDNLIEELQDLDSEKKHRVASFLEPVMIHTLLLQFWQAERYYNSDHWKSEILAFQSQLERYLTTNLRNFLEQEFSQIYRSAVRYTRRKTKNLVNFPETYPYNLENFLDPNWLPPEE
jgi:Domain of unknown function DUF29